MSLARACIARFSLASRENNSGSTPAVLYQLLPDISDTYFYVSYNMEDPPLSYRCLLSFARNVKKGGKEGKKRRKRNVAGILLFVLFIILDIPVPLHTYASCEFLLPIIHRVRERETHASIHPCRYARATLFDSTRNEQTNEETYDCVKL